MATLAPPRSSALNLRRTTAPMSRPPSPHRARALDLLRQGKTSAEVAADLGVSVRTVEGWARALGRPRGITTKQGQEVGKRGKDLVPRTSTPHGRSLPVIDLLLQGERQSTIASSLGLSKQSVGQIKKTWL